GALQTTVGDAQSPVTLPPLNLSSVTGASLTNGVTIAAWIYPNSGQVNFTSFIGNRTSAGDAANFGFSANPDGNGMPALGYTWNNNAQATWGWNSGIHPVAGAWQLAVLVVASNSATVYLHYIDPNTQQPVLLSAVNSIAHTAEAFNSGGIFLGSDSTQGSASP